MTCPVVIPAYNEEHFLPQCLESLVAQKTARAFKVLVVDNNSTDATKLVAESYKDKLDITVISEKQKGRGAARFAGFASAQSDFICSTDADTILPSDWIEHIVTAFSDNSVAAVTGPCKIIDQSPLNNTLFNFFQPLSMRLYRVFFQHYWLSGFNFAIRREVYTATTGFNKSLNAQEDIELSFAVRKIGKIVFLNDLTVIFSGRRFDKGILHGLFPYARTFFKYFLLKDKSIELEDVRG